MPIISILIALILLGAALVILWLLPIDETIKQIIYIVVIALVLICVIQLWIWIDPLFLGGTPIPRR